MKTVSSTAQWTAAIRALEPEYGENCLYEDGLAYNLAGPEGFELLDRYKGAGVREFVSIRTRFFDDAISDIVFKSSVQQVILVAAGMDTRAFRMTWPDGVTIYEVDHKELLDEKGKRLSRLQARPNLPRVEVAADITQPWFGDLEHAGFESSVGALWVVEGLLFFLSHDQVGNLLMSLKESSAPNSHLITDMPSESLLKNPFNEAFLSKLSEDGCPWQFGCDEPEEFLRMHGWKVTEIKEPGESDAGKKRWPYSVQDRSIKGVPRSWLIRAELDAQYKPSY